MKTHTGKIGRQALAIRNELGRRIEDGEPGKDLVAWLNELPQVQAVLEAQFKGHAITEQNLSDWKQAGHQDWLRREAIRTRMELTIEDAQELAEGRKHNLGGHLATVLVLELDGVLTALLEEETDLEKRWKRLCEMNREVSRLRREDDRAARTVVQQVRYGSESQVQSPRSKVGEAVAEAVGDPPTLRSGAASESQVQSPESKVEETPANSEESSLIKGNKDEIEDLNLNSEIREKSKGQNPTVKEEELSMENLTQRRRGAKAQRKAEARSAGPGNSRAGKLLCRNLAIKKEMPPQPNVGLATGPLP
jgi:hypothetical protein